ncbi:TPA: antitoxin, partial [Corynebacterium striatum]|nr:antitoxin [Corynebacterium striatum]
DKAKDALNSEKGEQISDSVLDKGAEVAQDKLGEDKADQIKQGRDKLDDQIGNAGA